MLTTYVWVQSILALAIKGNPLTNTGIIWNHIIVLVDTQGLSTCFKVISIRENPKIKQFIKLIIFKFLLVWSFKCQYFWSKKFYFIFYLQILQDEIQRYFTLYQFTIPYFKQFIIANHKPVLEIIKHNTPFLKSSLSYFTAA